ncbi:MAG: CopG family transcriptional regulator [Firmicutes bacterium]|jgi:hypothetical protein|nr:CopG family transcriptional regulator [Bacillota bacterium]
MPLYIELTSEQEEALRRVAEMRQKTVEDIIAEWVQRLLEECVDTDWENRRARALNAVGRFRSGKRDVSEKHDKYLAEAFDR